MEFDLSDDGTVRFDEMDITGLDSSTALIALTEVDTDERWGMVVALLVDSQHQWAVYTVDLVGARRLRDSVISRVTELEGLIDNGDTTDDSGADPDLD